MKQVELVELNKNHVEEAAALFVDAFRDEAFTASWLDLSREKNRRLYRDAVRLKLDLCLKVGQPLYIVLADGRVAGLAVVKAPHITVPTRLWISMLLPRLPRLAGLLPNFLRARGLLGAARPPRNLPQAHYTLECLAVHPAYQGKGVGRLLLERVERLCRDNRDASGVYLLTGDEQNRSIYEKFSYHVVETRQARSITAYHMFTANPQAAGRE